MFTPRCKAVERTSVFVRSHLPSRGGAGPEAFAGFVPPSRVTKTRCDAQEREGVRPSAQCAHDNEVCGSVRGGDWGRRKAVRTFTRVARSGHARVFGRASCSARWPAPFSKEAA